MKLNFTCNSDNNPAIREFLPQSHVSSCHVIASIDQEASLIFPAALLEDEVLPQYFLLLTSGKGRKEGRKEKEEEEEMKAAAVFLYTQVRQLRVVTGPPCSRVPCEGRRLPVPCYREQIWEI